MDFSTLKVWIGIGITCLILTNIAFFHVIQRDFGSTGKKAFWCFVALFPFVGFLVYFLLGARSGKKPPA